MHRWRGIPAASQEARSLLKARKLGVAAPVLYHVDVAAACLYMEFVPGAMVKDRLFAGLDADGAYSEHAKQ
jgi:tRNA A-37 threonylcarbamoyl transferase component Bud32